jgi:N-methylhydantoinase A/oxoprolinase/acetone carboxylase beta subunit
MKRIGIDVGGTFTDFILIDDEKGASIVHKVPSTPHDPSEAIIEGVLEICNMASTHPSEIDQFFHGTTVATNIVLEHKGAKVGMLTTEGFRDILHIARHKRPYNFSLYQDLPWQKHPLVRRRFRLTVPERITSDGSVIQDLDEEKALEQIKKLKAAKVDAVAVCFLFSFKNPAHEKRVKELLMEEFPEAYLSISSEVLPQYREYERFSTVALNAYVGPKVSRYLKNLKNSIKQNGIKSELLLMQSNGGIVTAENADERPVNLMLSGPVAGLIGGIQAARNAGFNNVITLDIGGTSADIGVAPNGEMRMKHLLDTRIGAYNAMIPMVDIDTIGAGGGSIAYVDEGGIFRVGPQSAGADPGPACYGRGGELPTSTDANVILGRVQPESMLGGRMSLNPELARKAFETHIAPKLNMNVEEAAAGALKIMTHNMVNAIEVNSVRKGYDPRDFVLVAAGGAGPLFSCDIAEELNIPFVVVPPHPGITAAAGLLSTDIKYEKIRTLWGSLTHPDIASLKTAFDELEKEAVASLKAEGLSDDRIVIKRICDCRYAGQGYELRVDAPDGPINEAWVNSVIHEFHQVHEREYASQFPDQEVIAINIRVIGIGLIPSEQIASTDKYEEKEISPSLVKAKHEVLFWIDDELVKVETPFYQREDIAVGTVIQGPAILQQKDSTTVLPPYVTAVVDPYFNVVIDMKEKLGKKKNASLLKVKA